MSNTAADRVSVPQEDEKSREDESRSSDSPADNLALRRTPELIIGLVGPMGSGVSETGNELERILKADFEYECRWVKPSKYIRQDASRTDIEYTEGLSREDEIWQLQDIGNELRKKYGNSYLIEKCIDDIALDRQPEGFEDPNQPEAAKPRRMATIIDSIKHPEEVSLLREVYGDMFLLFAVFAPDGVRSRRLELDAKVSKGSIGKLIERDEDEGLDYGQKVSATCHLADFFIRNDENGTTQLKKVVSRYLNLIFNTEIITPNSHEIGMFNAMAAASKSACLSRQVGAAIYSQSGELIGVGCNDVPKAQGGLYAGNDSDGCSDQRCHFFGKGGCNNDRKKNDLYNDIFERLTSAGIREQEVDSDRLALNAETVKELLQKTDIKQLIEYSRSVHAEMEAIISVARSGTLGIRGSRLYTTTYPCHNCARHIVAAGVDQVFYIEPYSKSLAIELHHDSISLDEGQSDKFVTFLQYEGVSPRNIDRFFHNGVERKGKDGMPVKRPSKPVPILAPPLDSFARLESLVVQDLQSKNP